MSTRKYVNGDKRRENGCVQINHKYHDDWIKFVHALSNDALNVNVSQLNCQRETAENIYTSQIIKMLSSLSS